MKPASIIFFSFTRLWLLPKFWLSGREMRFTLYKQAIDRSIRLVEMWEKNHSLTVSQT
jgi:hypothetical protein